MRINTESQAVVVLQCVDLRLDKIAWAATEYVQREMLRCALTLFRLLPAAIVLKVIQAFEGVIMEFPEQGGAK